MAMVSNPPQLVDYLNAPDLALLYIPITDLEDAKTFIDMLVRRNLMFHFEDGPIDVIWESVAPNSKELQALEDRTNELYSAGLDWSTCGECPIGYALQCMKRHNKMPGGNSTTQHNGDKTMSYDKITAAAIRISLEDLEANHPGGMMTFAFMRADPEYQSSGEIAKEFEKLGLMEYGKVKPDVRELI